MFNKDSILKILEKKGWSKYKLCKEAHLAQSTLSDILSGKAKNPNTKTLQKIADALGVSINEFFDEDDNSKNTEEINIPQEYLKQYKRSWGTLIYQLQPIFIHTLCLKKR